MNCPNCQNPLPPDVAFCPECGFQLVQEQPEPTINEPTYYPQQPTYPQQPNPTEPAAPKKDSSKVLIAIIAVLVVVIIVGAAMIFMNKDKGSDTQPTTDSATTLSAFGDNTAAANADVTPADNTTSSTDNGPTNVTMPDKLYTTEIYYVIEPTGVLLKSGPSDSTNTLLKINYDSTIEIRGGKDSDDSWVYIYYREADAYGWVTANQISQTKPSTAKPADIQAAPSNNLTVIYYSPSYGAYVDVNSSNKHLYLRSTPDTASKTNIIESMDHADYITVYGYLESNPSWLYIGHNGNYGFAYSGYISNSKPSSSTYSTGTIYYFDSIREGWVRPSDGLILRSGPGKGYSKILTMPQGSYVEVIGKVNGSNWVYLRYYRNGTTYTGYSDGSYLNY
ncbi:MAG: SH3 domain-containing protein [Acutalibacteraceae bacterium]